MQTGYQTLDLSGMIFSPTTNTKETGLKIGKRFQQIIENKQNKAILVQNFTYNSPTDGVIVFNDVFALASYEIVFGDGATIPISINYDKYVINMFRTAYGTPGTPSAYFTVNIVCSINDDGDWVAWVKTEKIG